MLVHKFVLTPREEISTCIQDAFGWRFVNPPPSIEHASGPCQASKILRWKSMEFEVTGHWGKDRKTCGFWATRQCCHHFLDRKAKNTNFEWPAGSIFRTALLRSCEIHDWYFLIKKMHHWRDTQRIPKPTTQVLLTATKSLGACDLGNRNSPITLHPYYIHIHPSYHSWLFW